MANEPTAPGRPFAVMAKPVGRRCNLACEYCYYSPAPGAAGGGVMGDEVLENFICQYIEASEGPEIYIVWHGGEPALAGLDFFRRAVELQKRILPEGWKCWNNLQTNGILLDEEWCSFLAEEHFDVGLSIDGTARLHDRYRKDHGGNPSYKNAAESIRRLKAHGIKPDLLCTVNSSTAGEPLAVYRALREFDTGWLQFIPIVRRDSDGRLTADSVTPDGYGNFLCKVFDEWASRDIGRLDVQLFAEAARVWAGGEAGLCWMAPSCGRALIVEMDGGVYSCDHYVYPEYRLGDIVSGRLGSLASLPVQLRFGDDKKGLLPAQCRGSGGADACAHLAVCNGGCPKDRFANVIEGEPPLNYLCAGLEKFFSHARPVSMQIMGLSKDGLSPAAIMAELRRSAQAVWKNVGRNDPCPCGSGRKAKHCCWNKRV